LLDVIGDAERQLVSLQSAPAIRDEPDRAWVDGWLHRSYVAYWASR
jgi:hypothetical protein